MKMENNSITVHTNGGFNFIYITTGIIKCLFFAKDIMEMENYSITVK